MSNEYALLQTHPLPEGLGYRHPENVVDIANLETPALKIMTDFNGRPPVCIKADETVRAANQRMAHANVHALFVTNEEDRIIGFISSRITEGSRLGVIAERHGVSLADVTVSMAMHHCNEMVTINYKALSNALVGHIVRIMHEKSANYVLVVEQDSIDQETYVRGIFSAARIGRQIGQFVSGDLSSDNLADINRRI